MGNFTSGPKKSKIFKNHKKVNGHSKKLVCIQKDHKKIEIPRSIQQNQLRDTVSKHNCKIYEDNV